MPDGVISTNKIEIYMAKPCLLCGKSVRIDLPTTGSVICDECKALWSKLKYIDDNNQWEALLSDNSTISSADV